eukprot:scaffold7333_cov102-Isochrysis_galbana.AAC.1
MLDIRKNTCARISSLPLLSLDVKTTNNAHTQSTSCPPPYLSETAKIVGLHGTYEKFPFGFRRVLPAADRGRRLESVACSTSRPRAARWTPACQAMRHRSRLGCRPPVGPVVMEAAAALRNGPKSETITISRRP